MDVVDVHDERLRAGERLEELARSPGDLVHRVLRAREPDRRRDARGYLGRIRHERVELRERNLGSIVLAQARGAADDLDERPEGDAAPVRKAATRDCAGAVGAVDELLDEARLPEARLAQNGCEAGALARRRVVECVLERAQLAVAADEGGARATHDVAGGAQSPEPVRADPLRLPP